MLRRPGLDVLVVVAAEDVERIRGGDRLLHHRDRVGRRQRDVEAEVCLDLLCHLGRRELDTEGDHPQGSGEGALLGRGGRGRAGQATEPGNRCRTDTAALEQLAPGHAVLVLSRRRLLHGVRELLGELVCIELVVFTHVLPSPFASPPAGEDHVPQDTVGAVSRHRACIQPAGSQVKWSRDERVVTGRKPQTPGRPGPSAESTRRNDLLNGLGLARVASPTTPDAVMSRSMSIGTATAGAFSHGVFAERRPRQTRSRTVSPRS